MGDKEGASFKVLYFGRDLVWRGEYVALRFDADICFEG